MISKKYDNYIDFQDTISIGLDTLIYNRYSNPLQYILKSIRVFLNFFKN